VLGLGAPSLSTKRAVALSLPLRIKREGCGSGSFEKEDRRRCLPVFEETDLEAPANQSRETALCGVSVHSEGSCSTLSPGRLRAGAVRNGRDSLLSPVLKEVGRLPSITLKRHCH
jgi:hypothetical protein